MALLDQYGNPLSLPVRDKEEEMGATLTGNRSVSSGFVGLTGLTASTICDYLLAATQGNSQAWQAFCEIIEERDLHYLGVLNTRKRQVSQLPVTVEAGGNEDVHEKHADFVRDWLERGIFEDAMYDMLDAIAKGYSVLEVVWHCAPGNYYPQQLKYRPQRWFEVSYQDGESIWLRDENSVAQPEITYAAPEFTMKPLEPGQAFVHIHPSWSGLTIRQGLTRATAFNSIFKLFSNRDWGVFVQAFGIPVRVGKYGASASLKDRRVLKQAVSDVAGSLGCTIPDNMSLEFIEPKNGSGSSDTHEKRVKWLDEQTSKAVLGQTGTTDARSGTHASGQIHRLVQEDIERHDARLLSVSTNIQLVRQMIDYSFGPPKDGKYPRIRIGRPDETPIETLIEGVKVMGPQGWKVKAAELYPRFNLTPPESGDIIVGLTAQPQTPQPASVKPPADKPPQANPAHIPTPTNFTAADGQQGQMTLHSAVANLAARHLPTSPEIMDILTEKIAREAAGGLEQMTEAVCAEMMQATSLEDLQERLDKLNLPDDKYQEAMQQGLLLGELVGEAAMLESMKNA